MDQEILRRRVADTSWFHTIDLGNGVVTRGVDDTPRKLRGLDLPTDLTGKSVLDIGAWDGFFSFEAERRGASRVVAVDFHSWSESDASWGTKAGFELAREALHSKVEDVHADVMDLSPDLVGGTFDVVLLLGVLYHMEHPLLALERVASVTGTYLILETLIDMTFTNRPAAAFYPSDEHLNSTNWWGPNAPAVVGMLKVAGFSAVRVVQPRSYISRTAHLVYNLGNIAHSRLIRSRDPLPLSYLPTDRLVVHAYK
jgi:tRNA (mo5U34)-methyltransferase